MHLVLLWFMSVSLIVVYKTLLLSLLLGPLVAALPWVASFPVDGNANVVVLLMSALSLCLPVWFVSLLFLD